MVKYYVTMKKNEVFPYVLMWKRDNEKSKVVFTIHVSAIVRLHLLKCIKHVWKGSFTD